jgi:transposase
MRRKSGSVRAPAEQVVKDIRRATRRHFSAEDKIRIVLEGLRGEGGVDRITRDLRSSVEEMERALSREALEAEIADLGLCRDGD